MHFYAHGGNIHQVARRLEIDPSTLIDLSSNIAPSPPSQLLKNLANHSESLQHLPEPSSETLRIHLADYYHREPEEFVVGAGTTELLHWLAYLHAKKTALVPTPTYSEYERVLSLYQGKIQYFPLREDADFQWDLDRLEEDLPGVDMVFLCLPNNPTGTVSNRERLLALIKRFPDIVFVVDESYMPFVLDETERSLLHSRLPNVVILRSFSKVFALPGLRIGWLLSSNHRLTQQMRDLLSLWSVNSLAQKIGQDLIAWDVRPIREQIHQEKRKLEQQLQDIHWLKTYPSSCNFLLCRSSRYTSMEVEARCLRHRILVRDCQNFRGLDTSFFRVAIRQPSHMKKFLQVLGDFAS